MKAIFLILLLLTSASARADLNRGLILHLDWLKENMNGGHKCLAGNTSTPKDRNDLAELCMSQICGASDKVTNAAELAVSLMRNPEFQKNLATTAAEALEAIDKLLTESEKEKLLTVQAYGQLKSSNDLIPSATHSRLHDFTALTNEFKRASFKAGPNPQLPLILDREGSLSKLTDLSNEQKKWALDSLDHFAQSPIGREFLLQSITQPRDFLRIKYPDLSFKDALKIEGTQTQKFATQLLSGSNGSMIKTIPGLGKTLTDPTIQKAAKGEDLTDSEVSEFMTVRASARLFLDVLTPRDKGGQTSLLTSPSKESLKDFFQRIDFDQQITQYEADLKNPKKLAEVRAATFQGCYTNYIFQMATLPSRSQIEKAKENAKWAKDQIKSILGSALSTRTAQMVNGVVDSSFFSLPRSRESFHQYFIDKVRASARDSANAAKDYQELIKNGQHKPVALLSLHLDSKEYTIDQHFNLAQDLCEEFKIKLTSDHVLTSTGGIETSWVSTRKPEFGKAVMLHELGHIAFKSLNSDKISTESRAYFQDVQQCLAKNHPGGDALAPHNYVDEDWSDLIAGKGTDHPESNVGCELADQENDRYINLDLNNLDQEDDHSTAFFRALHVHKIRNGSLPAACNQMIESKGQRWEFKTCF